MGAMLWDTTHLHTVTPFLVKECGSGDVLLDFLVTKENRQWFLVEVKSSKSSPLSKHLEYFQTRTGAKHAFQVMMDTGFEDADCFDISYPVRVSGRSFLSQLV